MGKVYEKLTEATVKKLVRAGVPGMHGDGANLWLRVTKTRRGWLVL